MANAKPNKRGKKELVSQERWLETQFWKFDNPEDKREIDRMAHIVGVPFQREFRELRETIRKNGAPVIEAYRQAIVDMAPRILVEKQLRDNIVFSAHQKQRRASKQYRDERIANKHETLTRSQLHNAIQNASSGKDMDWAAEHCYPGVNILGMNPENIPSRTALNMLEAALADPTRFWERYDKEQSRRAGLRVSLSDSGQPLLRITQELLAERQVSDAEDFVVVADEGATDADVGT